MSKLRYWNGESPNLNSVSVAFSLETRGLAAEEIGALYRIAWHIASKSVHSFFSGPSEPEMTSRPETVFRIVGCSPTQWKRIRRKIAPFLMETKNGFFTLRDLEQIRLANISATRPALPMSTKKLVAERDAHRCVYCGDEEGPFHFDHLFPRSRGGSDKPANIVIACAPCNLSKGDKTLLEWMATR